jgi:GTP-binding protein
MSCITAIVGRPNVGKSTLFNRLSRSRNALVDDLPGITRDRLYASIFWKGTPMTLIDTGGFDDADRQPLLVKVREQVVKAIDEADRIIFMVDGSQGILPADQEMAGILRRCEKPVFLAVNKIDGPEHESLVYDFYTMGMEKAYPLSAAHGFGLNALMEDVVKGVQRPEAEKGESAQIRVSILGRPNAGKSSLINRILGIDRLLVSDLPGTTRDTVDTPFHWQGKDFLLIDTAGIRRRSRVKEKIEKFSVIKALKSLDRCHVAVILLDAWAGIAEQDARICGYAIEKGRAIILAVNKWDLIKKDPDRKKALSDSFDRQLNFISFAPRINLSALSGERVKTLFSKIDLLYEQFRRKTGTGPLNRAIEDMMRKNPPPRTGRGSVKLFYGTQTRTGPPTFVVFTNRPDKIHFSYKRFVVNQLREQLGLDLTPIRLFFKKK